MFTLLHHREFRTRLALLAFLSILGMGALQSYELIHDIYEPDCPAKKSGNPTDCLFCATFLLLAAETTPEVVLPKPAGESDFRNPPEITLQPVWQQISQLGRSPPLSS